MPTQAPKSARNGTRPRMSKMIDAVGANLRDVEAFDPCSASAQLGERSQSKKSERALASQGVSFSQRARVALQLQTTLGEL